MKVIFLDFDGVLNSLRYLSACGETGLVIDPTRMALLKEIVDSTGAQIVLSTSWREHWWAISEACDAIGREIRERFAAWGLEILDKTSQLPVGRTAQIRDWLDHHPETETYLILDDALLSAGFLEGHYIKTSNYHDGLASEDVPRAIAILNGK
jgi:hypothetical protein